MKHNVCPQPSQMKITHEDKIKHQPKALPTTLNIICIGCVKTDGKMYVRVAERYMTRHSY